CAREELYSHFDYW
nr:immunoglobulin heavy chain junction region [Macaca mulatta]